MLTKALARAAQERVDYRIKVGPERGKSWTLPAPIPTPIFRLIHIDNLRVCLQREALHAPNHEPDDGLGWKAIHRVDVQTGRRACMVPCGPGGVVHDYIPFYFGYLSPMLFQLKTGWVAGYNEGQEPLIYLVSTAQAIAESDAGFVFSDGHGLAAFTRWFDHLDHLDRVDWGMVYQRYWRDEPSDMDKQRRKQAEFLVHRTCDWTLVEEIAVINQRTKGRVDGILASFPRELTKPVRIAADSIRGDGPR